MLDRPATPLAAAPIASTEPVARAPLTIRMHVRDNVAIVANDGGLRAGTRLAGGLVLRDTVPQGHKVALADIAEGGEVRRYDVVIGHAAKALAAGSWVHERVLRMPPARSLDGLPMATVKREPMPALDGYTFEGFRNRDGSFGTRNILGITTTVQCVAGVVDVAVRRIKEELLPRFPNVDDVVGLEHSYGCGVAIRRRRCGRADPHAPQHRPQPELRQRGDGRQPRLREAAARAADAARNHRPGRRAGSGRAPRALTAPTPRSTSSACSRSSTSASCP